MKLETFFERFDQFAEAPNAVAKLRELVLQLAVRGKLVEQDADDEPAQSLLGQIAAFKTALAKEGKLRGPTTVNPMGDNEVQFEIPSNWCWVRFGEIMVNRDGERVPVSKEDRETKAKTYDYYGASGVIDKIDGYLFDKPLLLIGEDGANLINRSTPIAFIARGKYWVNNHAHVLDGISEDFLRFIEIQINANNLEKYVTGSAQPKMNQAKMNSIPVPLPPLAEQKRIVAKVDELMALCDRLEAQQQERETQHAALARASLARFADAPTPANLNYLFHQCYAIPPADLRKAILTLAVDGSLIKAGTNETQFGEVVDLLGGYAFKSEWFTKSSGIRLVRNQNISHGELDWRETEYLPTDRAHEFEKWSLRPGDLVLSLNRPFISTGLKLAWITDADCPCLLVQRIVCLRPDPERLLARYLFLWCNAPHFYRDAHVVPSSGVPYIAPNRVAQMKMQLPPLAEQKRIVAKVDQLMALVGALETQLNAARKTAEALMEAAVAELTGGEIVKDEEESMNYEL